MTMQELRDAKKLAVAQFLGRLPSVHAVGIGNKEIDGRDSGIPCVRVYLNRKETSSFTITSKIPSEILRVPTDVIALEDRLFHPLSQIELDTTRRPNLPLLKGSFGAVVRSGVKHYILGVNHVLALNGLVPAGREIRSNGAVVGSTLDDGFVPLQHGQPNRADCALAKFTVDPAAAPMIIGSPDDVVVPELGLRVRKVGAAKERDGTIVDISVDFVAHYSFGSFLLEDQILVKVQKGSREFAQDGDSGAVVAEDKKDGKAVGIVVASAGEFTAASPMVNMLEELEKLGVRFAPAAG
ncbi:MAG: hypothetical protein HY235_16375 [Acidobacteria bacterium]|nr:hypothetical protein [Acidobacteriota bacterium]